MKVYYTNYPQSEKLTKKSRSLAYRTTFPGSLVWGAIPGAILFILANAMGLNSNLEMAGIIVAMVGMVISSILAPIYRKKKSAQYDAEYQQILSNK